MQLRISPQSKIRQSKHTRQSTYDPPILKMMFLELVENSEISTCGLQIRCSATELHQHSFLQPIDSSVVSRTDLSIWAFRIKTISTRPTTTKIQALIQIGNFPAFRFIRSEGLCLKPYSEASRILCCGRLACLRMQR